jgi:photosystem II stability/assembly factor-like uncharacterized protein
VYVVVGDDGTLLSAPDAVTWTLRDPETSRNLEDVAFGDALFVVVGQKAVIRNSTDGLDWF